jgi:hypothetical protein
VPAPFQSLSPAARLPLCSSLSDGLLQFHPPMTRSMTCLRLILLLIYQILTGFTYRGLLTPHLRANTHRQISSRPCRAYTKRSSRRIVVVADSHDWAGREKVALISFGYQNIFATRLSFDSGKISVMNYILFYRKFLSLD